METLCVLCFLVFIGCASVTATLPCQENSSEWSCFANASCILNATSQCDVVASTCSQRYDRAHCHRGPQCFWTGTTCVDRYVPISVRDSDTYCHGLFDYGDIEGTGDKCNSDPVCEYDIYTAQCTVNRDLVCNLVASPYDCYVTAGCWWNVVSLECRSLSRDYMVSCGDFDADAINCKTYIHSCSYSAGPPSRCLALTKDKAYPWYPLMQYCRLDLIHPFKQFCDSTEDCVPNCGPPLKPNCQVTVSATALDVCQPMARFVCRFMDFNAMCVDYSFCDWNSTSSLCMNPAGDDSLAGATNSTVRVAVASGDHLTSAIIAVLVIAAILLLLVVIVCCASRLGNTKHTDRNPTQLQISVTSAQAHTGGSNPHPKDKQLTSSGQSKPHNHGSSQSRVNHSSHKA